MLILRYDMRRLSGAIGGCIIFIVIGVLMWMWEPSPYSILPWSVTGQRIVGALVFTFFGGCLAFLLWMGRRPILCFSKSGIEDPHRHFKVAWDEIRSCQFQENFGGQRVQWIGVNVHHAEKHAHISALDKRLGFASADLAWDLTLVSRQDFLKSQKYIEAMVNSTKSQQIQKN